MSPTWLEIAVAVLLLWVAWRIALLLTPLVLKRFRKRPRVPGPDSPQSEPRNITAMVREMDKKHEP